MNIKLFHYNFEIQTKNVGHLSSNYMKVFEVLSVCASNLKQSYNKGLRAPYFL